MQDLIDNTYRVTADELRQFIERIERLDAEKKDIADQQKEVMAEAKGRGYDVKVIRKLITLRRRDQGEQQAVQARSPAHHGGKHATTRNQENGTESRPKDIFSLMDPENK